ncbi:hypothetical protein HanIR_Chr06g0270531 [Helianthus annuus]|nr:hypothetical protein HanIR_Chr06g0270531 [Helianthus annuus]
MYVGVMTCRCRSIIKKKAWVEVRQLYDLESKNLEEKLVHGEEFVGGEILHGLDWLLGQDGFGLE